MKLFTVIDKQTGREMTNAELMHIVLTEQWADLLMYCDIDGWWIDAEGNLALVDDCGCIVYPPTDRFEVRWNAVGDSTVPEHSYP